jgi:hypothetical protein
MTMTINDFESRFGLFLAKNAATKCWLWTGPLNRLGVPKPVKIPGRGIVHPSRLVYETFVCQGSITSTAVMLLRTCGNAACVAPEHRDRIESDDSSMPPGAEGDRVLWFGAHEGRDIRGVPPAYLVWLRDNLRLRGRLKVWVDDELARRADERVLSPLTPISARAELCRLERVLEGEFALLGTDLVWFAEEPRLELRQHVEQHRGAIIKLLRQAAPPEGPCACGVITSERGGGGWKCMECLDQAKYGRA